jgi:ketosteroid isomerase-like protein
VRTLPSLVLLCASCASWLIALGCASLLIPLGCASLLIPLGCASLKVPPVLVRDHTLFAAVAARDRETIDELLAKDFVFQAADGHIGSRDEWIAYAFARQGKVKVSQDEVKLTMEGQSAMVCGVERVVAVGQKVENHERREFCDLWKQVEGRWLLSYVGFPQH